MTARRRTHDARAALLDVQQLVRDFHAGSSFKSLRERQRRLLNRLLRQRADAARDAADLGFTEGRGERGSCFGQGLHGMSVQHRLKVLHGIRAAVMRGTRGKRAQGGRP